MDITVKASLPWDDGREPNLDSPYRNLATAIVTVAVKDYKKTLRTMWKNPTSVTARRKLMNTKMEIEEFFHSGAYGMYCNVDPDKLIENCRRTAIEDEKKAIARRNKARIRKERKQQEQQQLQQEHK